MEVIHGMVNRCNAIEVDYLDTSKATSCDAAKLIFQNLCANNPPQNILRQGYKVRPKK